MGFTCTILRWIEYQSELNDVFRAERVCIDQDECVRYTIMFAKYTEKYTSHPPNFLDIGFGGRSRIEIASSNPMLFPYLFLTFLSLAGHHQPTSETPLKWCFAGGPMMAKH